MSSKKHIAIIGATSSIAEHCARLWLSENPCDLVLVGRNHERVDRIARDLRVRYPNSDIRTIESSFLKPKDIEDTVDLICSTERVDIVLIAQGNLPNQSDCQNSLIASEAALAINGISPVLFAEGFARHMAQHNHGTLAVIGSVAGDRGRRSNYVYGAAKSLVERYCQGLQHRFAGTSVQIVLIKPGPTNTPMTAHLKSKGAPLARVETVAQQIVSGIANGRRIIYTPRRWAIVMQIVRHLPAVIFNKINV